VFVGFKGSTLAHAAAQRVLPVLTVTSSSRPINFDRR
jgi:hypothetical protein